MHAFPPRIDLPGERGSSPGGSLRRPRGQTPTGGGGQYPAGLAEPAATGLEAWCGLWWRAGSWR